MKNKLMILVVSSFLLVLFAPSVSAAVPDAPSNLTFEYIFASHYNLSWTAPTSDGGSSITGYKIEYAQNFWNCQAPQSSCWNVLVADTGNTDTNYTHDITAAYAYSYRVSAINSEGTSLPSNYVNSAITAADVPDKPINVVANRVTQDQIDITWESQDDNGLPITGYKIENKYFSDGTPSVLVENTDSTETSYSHMSSHGYVYYRIYAINAMGTSQPSYEWVRVSSDSDISAPSAVRNLVVTEYDYDHFTLSWDPPEDDGNSAIIEY